VTFWTKFFDPAMTTCIEEEYLSVLEQLIRGKCLSKPHKATKLFAREYQRKLEAEGCLDEKNNLIVSKLRDAFMEDRMDTNELADSIRVSAE
jgi:hypothetical protein